MNDELISVPVYSALNRQNLFLGADRELALLLTLICAVLIIVALSFITAIIGIALWFLLINVLRMMAKADPMMRQIFIRQTKYATFYPAHSTPFVKET